MSGPATGRAAGPQFAELLREAARNTVCGATGAVLLLAVSLAVLVGLCVVEQTSIDQALRSERDFRARGGATLVLAAEGGIDGAACEDLTRSGLFEHAGALRSASRVAFRSLPASPVPAYDVTRGARALLMPDQSGAAAAGATYVSRAVAEDVAPRLLDPARAAGPYAGAAPLRIDAAFDWPDDGRDSSLNYAVVTVAPPVGAFDQCLAESRSTTELPTALLRSALNGRVTDPGSITTGQLNPTLGARSTALDAFTQRPGRIFGWVAALVGLCLSAASVRRRAIQWLNYRDCGYRFGAAGMIAVVEALVWAVVAALTTLAVSMVLAAGSAASSPAVVLPFAARIIGPFVAGAVLGIPLGLALIWRHRLDHFLRRA